ncbi:cell division protein ZapA [Leptothrix discophora]|uniref:Cell division protein ZapA n=1 Tax=Leptothrix discophora TaxID=89 RepID=A0ABT9G285_LEPDI|nr:cell division protein ZapA [Leptothrix discophora]MDP4300601.1 cell division protein ZapA [Leptothrix discophora]
MKQIEVSIMGQTYILACPEGHETELLEAVGSVDREMCGIRDAGRVKARERIAVLAALNLAYALAEQGRAPAPAASAPAASNGHAAGMDTGSVDVDALVRRVDAALGHDGQLL